MEAKSVKEKRKEETLVRNIPMKHRSIIFNFSTRIIYLTFTKYVINNQQYNIKR